jgi:hypothetical protein
MKFYYNLPVKQRRVQQLVDQFNFDENLWRSLRNKRRIRRKALPKLSPKYQKQLDLLEFAAARPRQDCIGFFLKSLRVRLPDRHRDPVTTPFHIPDCSRHFDISTIVETWKCSLTKRRDFP